MGLMGFPETSVTNNLRCLITQNSEALIRRQKPETAQAISISASQEIPRTPLNKGSHYRCHNSLSKPGINLRHFVGVKLPVFFPEYIRTPAGTNH
jgi:hypothetical protein